MQRRRCLQTTLQPRRRLQLVRNSSGRPVREDIDDVQEKENVQPSAALTTGKHVKEKEKKAGLGGSTSRQLEQRSTCSICYDIIKEHGKIDPCDHVFCVECIKNWSQRATTCPVCRMRFSFIKTSTSRPIFVQEREYRHEQDENEIYGMVSRLIGDDEDDSDDGADIDENGNLIGFIDYEEDVSNFPSVFECDDEEYHPSQNSYHETDDDNEEFVSTQDKNIISVNSSSSPPKKRKTSPNKKKRRIIIDDEDDDEGYHSDRTVVLGQEEIYENVVKPLLYNEEK